jgi:hypothetical protein
VENSERPSTAPTTEQHGQLDLVFSPLKV